MTAKAALALADSGLPPLDRVIEDAIDIAQCFIRRTAAASEVATIVQLQSRHTSSGIAEYRDVHPRQAEAVKQALVTRYHIAVDRLTPQGFGASRPKEPNDTLAGRARNRRVELVRE